MFLSKDDLKKAVPKKGGNVSARSAKPSSGSQGVFVTSPPVGKAGMQEETVDIAERARRERLQRLEQLEASRKILRLQTWWRHWSCRRKFALLLSATLRRKLDDLEKLSTMLAGKGVVFAPPPAAAMAVIAQMQLLLRLRPVNPPLDLLVRCCTGLLPSISAQTTNTACASALTCYALRVLPSLPVGSVQKTARSILAAIHGTVFGSQLESSGQLAVAVQTFLARSIDHLLATKQAGKGASVLVETLRATGLSELWPLIAKLRSPIELLLRPGLAHFFSSPLSKEVEAMLSSVLHEPAKWHRELRESAEGSMCRGHWLAGNVCSLLHSHLVAKDAAGTAASAAAATASCATIQLLLQCTLSLLESFPLPGFLQGIDGVVWTSQTSTQLTAHSIPWVLPCQYALLYDGALLDSLVQLGVPGEASLPEIPAQDQQEVQQVLSQTSLALVRVDYLQQQRAASSWGSWAKRLVPSMLTSLPSPLASLSSLFSSKPAAGPSPSSSTPRTPSVRANAVKPSGLASDVVVLLHVLLSPATSSPPHAVPWKALTGLVFNPRLRLTASLLAAVLAAGTSIERLAEDFDPAVHALAGYPVQDRFAALFLLAASLRTQLLATDDLELYQNHSPLPLPRMLPLLRAYKTALFKILGYCPTVLDGSTDTSQDGRQGMLACVARNLQQVLVEMYSRWARRPFCLPGRWQVAATESASFLSALEGGTDIFAHQVLRFMPYALPFRQRLQLARRLLDADRVHIQGSNDPAYLMAGGQRSRGVVVRVHRHRLLEDAMRQMGALPVSAWRDRMVIRYINQFGEEEAGIDAGGLFKDFLTDLSQLVFSASYGLFAVTHDQLLYPNPAATALYDAHALEDMYLFIGRVLGKAVLENIALGPQFASFFLNAFHACSNLVNDLSSLDPDLFRNLTFLKSYDGDLDELCLTFSVTDDALGASREVDLVPRGREVAVTAQNKHRYIHAVAKYYLRDRIRQQAAAFFRGLHEVVTRKEVFHWFCAPELQILISGAQSGIDVADLQAHTRYAGGYFPLDPTITRFWSVVTDFSEQERAQLLAFVTACPRPPSLGFSALDPPFTVQKVDCPDDRRLPTASTCFNILKLPAYSSKKVLREKLLAAITSKAGFDLS